MDQEVIKIIANGLLNIMIVYILPILIMLRLIKKYIIR